jgi:hypothetical protein
MLILCCTKVTDLKKNSFPLSCNDFTKAFFHATVVFLTKWALNKEVCIKSDVPIRKRKLTEQLETNQPKGSLFSR